MHRVNNLLAILAIVCSLVGATPHSRNLATSRKTTSVIGSNDVGTPCSTNISNAYLNVALMIDVSTHMTNENLRLLSLNLQNSFAKLNIGNFWDLHTSGFMVVAYSDTAKVVSNLTQIRTKNDLAQALSVSSLKQGTLAMSASAAGIREAFGLTNNILDDYVYSCKNCTVRRNTAYIFIGASSTGIDTSGLYNDIYNVYSIYPYILESFMSINLNPSDVALTALLNNISHFSNIRHIQNVARPEFYPAYNFKFTDKNMWTDLTYALTEAVCTCWLTYSGIFTQLVFLNQTVNKWVKFADCYSAHEFDGFEGFPASGLCSSQSSLGAAITSKAKSDFINQYMIDPQDYKYYLGLQRNVKKQWVWTDYDGMEFPLGNYAPWAPGFGLNSPGDCVAAYNQNSSQLTFLWKPISCYSENVLTVCQELACDADSVGCQTTTWNVPNEGKCGNPIIKPEIHEEIVGGTTAKPYSWPWQVALCYESDDGTCSLECGGTVIGANWVMTAGHCVYGSTDDTDDFRVKTGVYDERLSNETGEVLHKVKAIYLHPKYNPVPNPEYDISLIELEENILFNTHVQPICIPKHGTDDGFIAEPNSAWATGWGTMSEGGDLGHKLRQVNVPFVNYPLCEKEYQYTGFIINSTIHVCAGRQGKDTCQGDSGGPLQQQSPNGYWFEYGITSFGNGCAEKDYPGIYSRVSAYCDFIEETTQGAVKCQDPRSY